MRDRTEYQRLYYLRTLKARKEYKRKHYLKIVKPRLQKIRFQKKRKKELNARYYQKITKPRNDLIKKIKKQAGPKADFESKAVNESILNDIVTNFVPRFLDSNELQNNDFYELDSVTRKSTTGLRFYVVNHYKNHILAQVDRVYKNIYKGLISSDEIASIAAVTTEDIIADIVAVLLL